MLDVDASANREEGIDLEEDDDFAGGGDLKTSMAKVIANGNGVDGGDGGVKIREKGAGNLSATLVHGTFAEFRLGVVENLTGT